MANGVSGSNAYQNVHLIKCEQPAEAGQGQGAQAVNGQQRTLQTQNQTTVQNGGNAPAAPPPPTPSADAQQSFADTTQGYANPPAQDPIKKALEDLKQDPDYQQILSELAFFEGIEDGFYAIDAQFGGSCWSGLRDGKINIGNIEAAAADASSPGHAAAQKLLQNAKLLSKLDSDGDGLYSKAELSKVIADLKTNKTQKETDVRAAASPPPPAPAPGTTAPPPPPGGKPPTTSPPPGSGDSATGTTEEYKFNPADLEIKQFKSSATGTGELLADSLGHVQSEIERLTDLKAKALAAGKPEDAARIDAQINKMNMCLQMVMSSMQQNQTMLSNIAKMWSDMAMTSIRNTH
ncbi:MAG: hypothetical protein AMXMBFR34_03960 [Myxococcaceae bacterium]